MSKILETWQLFRNNLIGVLKPINLVDFIDILIVAYIFYSLMRLVRETRAMQLLKGIAAILVLFFVANILEMTMLQFFIRNILTWGVIVIAVVFQPELRRALEQMGRTKFSPLGRGSESEADLLQKNKEVISAVCAAGAHLSSRKIGALIVIEREIKLGDVINTGTIIDSRISMELIANIFFPNSPMHDGAVVVRQGRLHSAGCFLPLSANMEIGRELGTRHRAALGMSEVSDAVIVVVSEETGAISVAVDSRLQRGLSVKNLEKMLEAKLIGTQPENTEAKKAPFWRRRK